MSIETTPENQPKRISRREAILLGAGAVLGTGASVNRRLNNTPSETLCDNIPAPTGSPLFDVYGNKVDSNELITLGYAEAVRNEDCRQENNED